jgi:hypothetical protein
MQKSAPPLNVFCLYSSAERPESTGLLAGQDDP